MVIFVFRKAKFTPLFLAKNLPFFSNLIFSRSACAWMGIEFSSSTTIADEWRGGQNENCGKFYGTNPQWRLSILKFYRSSRVALLCVCGGERKRRQHAHAIYFMNVFYCIYRIMTPPACMENRFIVHFVQILFKQYVNTVLQVHLKGPFLANIHGIITLLLWFSPLTQRRSAAFLAEVPIFWHCHSFSIFMERMWVRPCNVERTIWMEFLTLWMIQLNFFTGKGDKCIRKYTRAQRTRTHNTQSRFHALFWWWFDSNPLSLCSGETV